MDEQVGIETSTPAEADQDTPAAGENKVLLVKLAYLLP